MLQTDTLANNSENTFAFGNKLLTSIIFNDYITVDRKVMCEHSL